MTRLSRHPFSIVLALVSQVLLALFGPALILCQEEDGRTAMEVVLSGCCDTQETAAPAPPSPAPGIRASSECGPCSDTSHGICLKEDQQDQLQSLDLASAEAELPLALPLASTYRALCPPPDPGLGFQRLILAILATVVLRC